MLHLDERPASPLVDLYKRLPLRVAGGDGAWLIGDDGRRYLDFASGIACTALGHNHPRLRAALFEQGSRVWHCSNRFEIPEQAATAARLTAASFAARAFFCNSGAEANEAALKMMRRCQWHRGRPERWRTVVFTGAFHGRTLATLAATDRDDYRLGFGPRVDGFDRATFNDLASARAAIGPETAGILVEPVQGDGGVRVAEPGFLRGLAGLAQEHGLVLMLDEIQSGIGRTGTFLAHEQYGVTPDIVSLAKGLGGGFPVGAVLVSEDVAAAMAPGSHGTTFGGNPLAMAVAGAVIGEVTAPGFLGGVRELSAELIAGLDRLAARWPAVVAERRGIGLLLGLRTVGPNAAFEQRCLDEGLVVVAAADNVVRLLPPLTLTAREAEAALVLLDRVCAALA